MHWQQHRNTGKHIHAMTMDLLLLLSTEAYASFWTLWIAMLFKHFDLSVSFILSSHVRDKTFRSKSKSFFPSQVKICISVDQTTLSPQTTAYTTRIALATRGRHWSPSSRKRTRWAPCLGDGTRPRTVSWGRWNSLPSHCIFSTTLNWAEWLPARQRLNWNISALARHALNSPRTRHEVAVSHEQLVGSCCLGPLGGVHGDRFNAGATAYGLLERHHISIQQGHTGQGITQETWHGSLPPQWPCSHQQHREEGTLWVPGPVRTSACRAWEIAGFIEAV